MSIPGEANMNLRAPYVSGAIARISRAEARNAVFLRYAAPPWPASTFALHVPRGTCGMSDPHLHYSLSVSSPIPKCSSADVKPPPTSNNDSAHLNPAGCSL